MCFGVSECELITGSMNSALKFAKNNPQSYTYHMEKREFPGSLSSISPNLLLGEKENDLDDFFLVLSVIFNDLKGLLFFGMSLEENYRTAPGDELSVHSGEVGGLQAQQYRLLAGLIREFLAFLKENIAIIKSPAFHLILLKANRTNKELWNDLTQIAFDDEVKTKSTFVHSLMLIRNNAGFHYDQSRKELRKSFKGFFNKTTKNPHNARAYYSLGQNMRETRFYYADAAVKEYISMKAGEVTDDKNQEAMSFEDHFIRLQQMVSDMNHTIGALLQHYLELKRKN